MKLFQTLFFSLTLSVVTANQPIRSEIKAIYGTGCNTTGTIDLCGTGTTWNVTEKQCVHNTTSQDLTPQEYCAGATVDACGVCGGSGIPEGKCDCFGATEGPCGVCGGSGILEGKCDCFGNVDPCGFGDWSCGEGPPGMTCDELWENSISLEANSIRLINNDGSWEVWYNSDTAIGGFQFDINGVTGASGGDAAANGFLMSASPYMVLGFSSSGTTIPAGEGILLELAGTPSGISSLVFSDAGGRALDFNLIA